MTNSWKSDQLPMAVPAGILAGAGTRDAHDGGTRQAWPRAGRGLAMQPIWRERAYEHIDELLAEAAAERATRGDVAADGIDTAPARRTLGLTTRARIRLGRAMVAAGRSIAGPDDHRVAMEPARPRR